MTLKLETVIMIVTSAIAATATIFSAINSFSSDISDIRGRLHSLEKINYELETFYTFDKVQCTQGEGYHYIGPNLAREHGGYCVRITRISIDT